jgi:hypothetical protein
MVASCACRVGQGNGDPVGRVRAFVWLRQNGEWRIGCDSRFGRPPMDLRTLVPTYMNHPG